MPQLRLLSGLSDWVGSAEVLDALPLASQGKSIVQALAGDRAGAARTQENFSRRCVGISQLRAVVEHRRGDEAAAAATQEEFRREIRQADEAFKKVVEGGASMAHAAEQAAGHATQRLRQSELGAGGASIAQKMTQDVCRASQRAEVAVNGAVEQARQKAQQTNFGAGVVRSINELMQQGSAVRERAAQRLAEADFGRRFSDLVEGVARSGLRQRSSSSAASESPPESSSSLPQQAPVGRPSNCAQSAVHLNSCTLLTKVSTSQVGEQCPCCMEDFEEGENIRVLPCFHVFHQNCADPWLQKMPDCPLCRCDIRSSLEKHRA